MLRPRHRPERRSPSLSRPRVESVSHLASPCPRIAISGVRCPALEPPVAASDRSCQTQVVRMLAPEAFHPVIRVIARAYFRIRLESVEPIPPQGPLIIAPNHVTYA